MTETFPRQERGFFHLTENGWLRCDFEPFPLGRIETWQYASHCQADDAKENVRLIRVWSKPDFNVERLMRLHNRFGDPVQPSPERNVTLECRV